MKAYMDENGSIHISPESGVEAFALKRFAGELMTLDGQEVYPARKIIVEKSVRGVAVTPLPLTTVGA